MKPYIEPIVVEEDDGVDPQFIAAINAVAVANVIAIINAALAVAILNQGLTVTNYSSQTTYYE